MKVYIASFSLLSLEDKYCVVSAESEKAAKEYVISELNRNDYGAEEDDIILKEFYVNESSAVLLEL